MSFPPPRPPTAHRGASQKGRARRRRRGWRGAVGPLAGWVLDSDRTWGPAARAGGARRESGSRTPGCRSAQTPSGPGPLPSTRRITPRAGNRGRFFVETHAGLCYRCPQRALSFRRSGRHPRPQPTDTGPSLETGGGGGIRSRAGEAAPRGASCTIT